MKQKGKLGFLIIIVLILIASIIVIFQYPRDDVYKVTITGTAYYDAINKWGVTYSGNTVEQDKGFISTLFYWPWETKDVVIVVEISQDDKTYTGESWIGTLSGIVGSQSFSVELRHVPSGSYSGKIYLYEVEKEIFGEKSRVLKATRALSEVIVLR